MKGRVPREKPRSSWSEWWPRMSGLLPFLSWVGHLWEGRGSGKADQRQPLPTAARGDGEILLTAVRIISTSPSPLIACLACRLLCLPGASHGPTAGTHLAPAWGGMAIAERSSLLPSPGHSWWLHPGPWTWGAGTPAIPCLSSPHPRELPPGSRDVERASCSWRSECPISPSFSALSLSPHPAQDQVREDSGSKWVPSAWRGQDWGQSTFRLYFQPSI